MKPELTWLLFAVVLTFGHVLVATIGAQLQVGRATLTANRVKMAELKGWAGRAQRAHRNMLENMVLFVGKAAGSYKSYDTQVQNELFRKQFQEQVRQGGNFRLDRNITGSGTGYYQFINYKKLVRKEMLGNDPYVINDVLPVVTWHISNNTANFGELHCQKATCHFKGRDYTAWFCPDLPVHVGPWKLNSLPGVIVEACDAK